MREQVNVTWIEFLSFVEISVALVPVASPSLDISEGLRNATVIGQKLVCLLKVLNRSVVVL